MLKFKSFIFLFENKKYEFFAKQAKMTPDQVEKLAAADPNPKKQNLGWLIKQHKKHFIRSDLLDTFHPWDMQRHREALEGFEKDRKRFGPIEKYPHVGHLRYALETGGEEAHKEKFGEKVYSEKGHEIYKVTTPDQATNHGCSTNWCTRLFKGHHQTSFLSKGTLYPHYHPGSIKPGEEGHEKETNKSQFFIPHHSEEDAPAHKNDENNEINTGAHENRFPELKHVQVWKDFKKAQDVHAAHSHDDEDEEQDLHDHIYNLAHGSSDEKIQAITQHDAHINDHGHLYDDPDSEVKKAIIDHETTKGFQTRDRVHGYYKDDDNDEVKQHVAENAGHPGIIKHMIDNHWDTHEVRSGLAANPHTPQAIKHKLIEPHEDDTHWGTSIIHNQLAMNPRSIWKEDAHPSYDSSIHHKLIDHHNFPNNKYDMNHFAYDNIAESVKNSTRGDKTLIDKMATGHSLHGKLAVAKHFGDDPKYFAQLKNEKGDNAYQIHQELGKHHPAHYVHQHSDLYGKISAAHFGDEHVHDQLIANHPPDGEVPMRSEIKNGIIKNGVARHLAHFKDDSEIVDSLQRRYKYPHDLTEKGIKNKEELSKAEPHLATSQVSQIRQIVADKTENPQVLHSLKDDPNPGVRINVAKNYHTSKDTILHMQNDGHEMVRYWAGYRINRER